MPASDIAQISVALTGPAPAVTGFSSLLILTPSVPASWAADKVVGTYTSLTEASDDGWTTALAGYNAAAVLTSQRPRVRTYKIGRCRKLAQIVLVTISGATEAEVATVTITVQDKGTPTVIVGSYTVQSGDAEADVRAGLISAIDTAAAAAGVGIDASDGSGTGHVSVAITSTTAGVPFTVAVSGTAVDDLEVVTEILIEFADGGAGDYTVDLDSVSHTYTALAAEDAEDIRDGWFSEVDGEVYTKAKVGTTGVTLRSRNGVAITAAASGALAGSITVRAARPNWGYFESAQFIRQSDRAWYGLYGTDRDRVSILQRALYVETLAYSEGRAIHGYDVPESAIDYYGTDDVVQDLEDLARTRSFGLVCDSASQYAALAWMARCLAINVDQESNTWAHHPLAGVSIAEWTTAKQTYFDSVNANYYVEIDTGRGGTYDGLMASGDYIDNVVAMDVLEARLTTKHRGRFADTSALNKKLPNNNAGYAVVEADARAVVRGLMDAGWFTAYTDLGEGETNPYFPTETDVATLGLPARTYSYELTLTLAEAIHRVQGNVSLVITLEF